MRRLDGPADIALRTDQGRILLRKRNRLASAERFMKLGLPTLKYFHSPSALWMIADTPNGFTGWSSVHPLGSTLKYQPPGYS